MSPATESGEGGSARECNALLIGCLFAINQLDVVLAGRATAAVWVKVALTYLVPFCVSNWGVLVATRRPGP